MSAKIEYHKDSLLVRLEGELDHHSACLIRAGVDDAALSHRPKLLTLDFSAVSFMDSSGVGLVMGRYKLISKLGGRVELCGLSPSAEKMMRLAGLERIVSIKKEAVI